MRVFPQMLWPGYGSYNVNYQSHFVLSKQCSTFYMVYTCDKSQHNLMADVIPYGLKFSRVKNFKVPFKIILRVTNNARLRY